MLETIQSKISGLKSELNYRLALVKHARNLPALLGRERLIVDALKRDGAYITSLAELELPSTTQLLYAANSHLSSIVSPRDSHADYKLPQIYTVTDLPEFFAWGIEKKLQNIIENYIGLPIAFHGVHLRKDFPNEQQLQTLLWHKDAEDRRMIKVIIYLNDVTDKHGPFEYVPKRYSLLERLTDYRVDYELLQTNYLGINDEKLSKIIPKSAWKSCPGKAGTVIFVDPRNILHHGTVRTQERSTLFFTYTANPPKRPELCRQYKDDTFTKPSKKLIVEGRV
ncbi:Phytanoyl-CoA dioxygenase (PhyH) [Cylindrospermum stagnale PCC 7417]|uniref:Phytanoyl-CoA dioxygenase (PhyH) n=1 Tax=Cylindrospermum stagnale PCC 7417 TaxID=56107 RepID=K9X3T3_9NOST|nr:phytanoyl-CoA dioxygenase family protein [Cylindrospermum stagnale]AFZ26754.1 Phytanoyl-CoA dioxygenase (PhyH) [Cylindrospermum stagnale PCC 7417]